MVNICHGGGDPTVDGCCWVNGEVCPLRWKLDGGHIWDHLGNDLGTVDAYIDSVIPNKPGRDRAKAQVQGTRIVCRAAIEVLIGDPKLLNDRAGFETAWNTHTEYVELVRPAWANIEQKLGLSEGEYQCSTWRGTGRPQCCFAETQQDNDSKSASLSTDARAIRQAGA